jgi:uncharacterized protein (DUF427 family)
VEETSRHIQVIFNGVVIADSYRARRVLETYHPPVYYVPAEDVRMAALARAAGTTFCEWKGAARYYDVTVAGKTARQAAWSYPKPLPAYAGIAGYIAFYPALMDACLVDGEQARPQPGGFYGGWITNDIAGPFKGSPGTMGW